MLDGKVIGFPVPTQSAVAIRELAAELGTTQSRLLRAAVIHTYGTRDARIAALRDFGQTEQALAALEGTDT